MNNLPGWIVVPLALLMWLGGWILALGALTIAAVLLGMWFDG